MWAPPLWDHVFKKKKKKVEKGFARRQRKGTAAGNGGTGVAVRGYFLQVGEEKCQKVSFCYYFIIQMLTGKVNAQHFTILNAL